MIIALIGVSILLVLSLIFEIRELRYMRSFQRPDSDDEGCLYQSFKSDSKGIVSVNCRNKFYSRKFIKNDGRCPSRCHGQTSKECSNNFETMSRTDKYFVAKKAICILSTVLCIVSTLLNIFAKV